MSNISTKFSHWVPFALAGAALMGGFALAFTANEPAESTTLPTDVRSSSPAASASAVVTSPKTYTADLSPGPPVELLLPLDDLALAIGICGGRLLWFSTDKASLRAWPLDGGPVEVLFESDNPNAFGGSAALSAGRMVWSVADTGDGEESVFAHNGCGAAAPSKLGAGNSPDNLVDDHHGSVWSDLGDLVVADGKDGAKVLAERNKRIASLTRCDGSLYWLESGYKDLKRADLMMRSNDGIKRLSKLRDEASRGSLVCAGKTLYWTESRPNSQRIATLTRPKTIPTTFAGSGTVSVMSIHDGWPIWAEVHTVAPEHDQKSEPAVVSLVRGGDPIRRHARRDGHITALTVHGPHVIWSGKGGIARVKLQQ